MRPVIPARRQSRHGFGLRRQLAPAWILGTGLFTGCQTFNYTEADFARERARVEAWAAGPHAPWGGHVPAGGGFGRLDMNVGRICLPSAGGYGGQGR